MKPTDKAKAIKKGQRYYYSEPCELHPRSGRYTDTDECVDCSKGVGAIQKVDCQAENEAVTALEDSTKGNTPVKEPETNEGENLGKTLISRKDALAQGLTRYFTGKACKYGHIAERRVIKGDCVACNREYDRKYYQDNREYYLEYGRGYSRKWYQDNREHHLEYNRKWREKNRERYLEYNREYARKWSKENPDKCNAKNANRRAAKLQRTYDGFEEELELAYKWASDISEFLDSPGWSHVDHIVPLQGDIVSGLHVPHNLEVVPAEENLSKGNRFVPFVEVFDANGEVIESYESPYEPEEELAVA